MRPFGYAWLVCCYDRVVTAIVHFGSGIFGALLSFIFPLTSEIGEAVMLVFFGNCAEMGSTKQKPAHKPTSPQVPKTGLVGADYREVTAPAHSSSGIFGASLKCIFPLTSEIGEAVMLVFFGNCAEMGSARQKVACKPGQANLPKNRLAWLVLAYTPPSNRLAPPSI